MNEKKKMLIVVGVLVAIIVLILVSMFISRQKGQKIIDSFNKAFESSTEQIVYLGRPGCSHCANFKPILNQIVSDYGLTYLDINTDELSNKQLTQILEKLGLEPSEFGTPTTVVVKNKEVLQKQIGETDEETFKTLLQDANVIDSE